ncbi:hypothetical protein [Thauera sp.]|uniref:hypothetical protein n=1 Tax=Thauera sp. TaxID=1905334 RepID=UPI002CEC791B|nr:hypothetical protein [Thauera sp.]HRP26308.1 hypothetical protein [Thauera sp.]
MTDTTQLTETVDERDAPVGDDIEKMRAAKEKANAEAAARRLEVKALKEELDALKQTQAATETAALAEQGKFKELYETAENRAATLEKQLREQADEIAAQKLALLRQQVATEKGLPAALADRLQGTTAEELTADADTLLAAMPRPNAPALDGGARGNGNGPTVDEMNRILSRYNISPRYLEKME